MVNEDSIFDIGKATPVLEHSNPVIRRILDAIDNGESLEVLYVIKGERYLGPRVLREYEYREIKPLEVLNSSAWTKSLYIIAESESEGEIETKTFRADRMALLNLDGTICIGGDIPCASEDCSNQVRIELDENNQSVLGELCSSCRYGPEPSPKDEHDEEFSDISTIDVDYSTMTYNSHSYRNFEKDGRIDHDQVFKSLDELREKLLDLSRRNRLINFPHSERGTYFLRVVDEVPDELLSRLLQRAMQFVPLPEIDEEPEDEKTQEFQANLAHMRETDHAYIEILEDEEMEKSDPIEYQGLVNEADRELKNRVRAQMGLPKAQSGSTPDLREHAKVHNIDPDYELPMEPTRETHKDADIQTLLLPNDLDRRLRNLYQRSRDFIRETGINVLLVSFGFLEWTDSTSSDKSNVSPLLLIPITIDRKKTGSGHKYSINDDGDIEVNQTLSEALNSKFGLKLPEFEFDDDTSLANYFKKITRAIQKFPGWKVRTFVTMGIFGFQKISIYRDLFPQSWDLGRFKQEISSHDLVASLLGGKASREPVSIERISNFDELTKRGNAPPLILDADSSQHSAIQEVLNGEPLVIQGPPGTGKSQTIANLIAANVAEGKKVLFVAEKKPALDVVAARLNSVGLEPLLLEPNPRGSKQEFLDSLRVHLRARERTEYDEREYLAKRDALIQRLKFTDKIKLLLTDTTNFCELSFFELVWKYIRIRYEVPRELRNSIGTPLVNYVNSKILDDGRSLIARWFELDVTNPKFADLGGFTDVSPLTISIEQFQNEAKELLDSIKELQPIFDQVSPNARIDLLAQSLEAVRSLTQNGLELLTGEQLNHEYGYLLDEDNLDLTHKKLKEALKISEKLSDDEQNRFDQLMKKLPIEEANKAKIERLIENSKSTLASLKILAKCAKLTHSEGLPVSKIINLTETMKTVDVKRLVDNLNTGVDLNDEQFSPVLSSTIDELEKVQSEIERLRLKIPMKDALSLDWREVKKHATSIGNARFPKFLFSNYRKAKQFAVRMGIELNDKEEAIRSLRTLERTLEKAEIIRTDKKLKRLLGGLFNGVQSNIESLVKLKRDLETLKPSLAELNVDSRTLVLALGELASTGYEEISENIDERKNCNQLCSDWEEFIADLLEVKELADNTGLLGSENIWNPDLVELESNLISLFPELKNYTNWKLLRESEKPMEDAQRRHASKTRITDYNYDQLRECTEVKSKVAKVLSNVDVESAGKFQNSVNRLSELVSVDSLYRRVEKFIEQYHSEHKDSSPGFRVNSIGDIAELAITLEKILGFDSSDIKRSILKAGFDEDLREYWWPEFFSEKDLLKEFEEKDISNLFELILVRTILQKFASENKFKLRELTGVNVLNNRNEFRRIDDELRKLEAKRTLYLGLRKFGSIPLGSDQGSRKTWTNLRLILHELKKKKRHISIRQLILRAKEALLVMKPVWLMDPIAVSRYLPKQRELFDLVVIDEASQMLPESAIASIVRGRQLVVVGDDMQMPPSNIFVSRKEYSDEEEPEIESESILDLATEKLGKTVSLRWHYRSRHESLISFSNKHFYDERLQVFPSPRELGKGLGISRVQVRGKYAKGLNVPEADEVITQLKKCMRNYPEDSIGIVAMNIRQQDYINELLNQMKDTDPIVSGYFERWEQDPLNSLFVKNLENVQGDERDTIIISTVYGPDADGKMYQRFPLINTEMGHRRLNVLFTRAKNRLILVTSMRASDVELNNTSRKGKRALRDYIEYAGTGRLETGQYTGVQPESDLELSVMDYLKNAGYEPVPQVGVKGFRIDIGVKHPDYPDGYIAGIEVDGATYHSSPQARDRDKIRQDILESQGWKIYRIWSTDWFEDPDKETEKMLGWLEKQRTSDPSSKTSDDELTIADGPVGLKRVVKHPDRDIYYYSADSKTFEVWNDGILNGWIYKNTGGDVVQSPNLTALVNGLGEYVNEEKEFSAVDKAVVWIYEKSQKILPQ